MNHKIQTLLFGTIVTGSLMLPAAPALARDYWHWAEREHRWERRADIRSDYRDLNEARRQLEWDRNHRGGWRRVADDEARVAQLERDIREDRRTFR